MIASGDGAGMGKRKGGGEEFEYCDVCRRNHNEGRKHRYFPSHARALSAFLSRFLLKLSPLLLPRDPSALRPPPPLWCPFCRASFAWDDAVHHLAGEDHLRDLKAFLWKHGAGMDRLDSFRVSRADLIKWEKKCETLRTSSTLSNGVQGLADSKAKDIHNQFTSNNIDSFGNEMSMCFASRNDCGVLPLQSHTDENCRALYCEVGEHTKNAGGSFAGIPYHSDFQQIHVEHLTGGRLSLLGRLKINSFSGRKMDQSTESNEWASGYHQNAHSDTAPWLRNNADDGTSSQSAINCLDASSSLSAERGRTKKLNPKRVGASWAEKRRAELEMEKKGLFVTRYDPNWLPDFGGVWQAGTRKESRKEFLTETKKIVKSKLPEISVALQPYISKRMRLELQGSEANTK